MAPAQEEAHDVSGHHSLMEAMEEEHVIRDDTDECVGEEVVYPDVVVLEAKSRVARSPSRKPRQSNTVVHWQMRGGLLGNTQPSPGIPGPVTPLFVTSSRVGGWKTGTTTTKDHSGQLELLPEKPRILAISSTPLVNEDRLHDTRVVSEFA